MKQKQVAIYNPTSDDFKVTYDVSGKGIPVEFTIYAEDIGIFDPIVANHIKKHLVNHLVNISGQKPNIEVAVERYMKEISVELWKEPNE